MWHEMPFVPERSYNCSWWLAALRRKPWSAAHDASVVCALTAAERRKEDVVCPYEGDDEDGVVLAECGSQSVQPCTERDHDKQELEPEEPLLEDAKALRIQQRHFHVDTCCRARLVRRGWAAFMVGGVGQHEGTEGGRHVDMGGERHGGRAARRPGGWEVVQRVVGGRNRGFDTQETYRQNKYLKDLRHGF